MEETFRNEDETFHVTETLIKTIEIVRHHIYLIILSTLIQ